MHSRNVRRWCYRFSAAFLHFGAYSEQMFHEKPLLRERTLRTLPTASFVLTASQLEPPLQWSQAQNSGACRR
jgi:hypothetical protein